jgi:hypothetical protein
VFSKKLWIFAILVLVVAAGLGVFTLWQSYTRQQAAVGPFRYGVDTRPAIEWDGKNIISGWAFSRATETPLTVTLLAQEKTLGSMPAERPRGDTQTVFSHVPHAGRSGFEFVLQMKDMPRGRYPLTLVLEDAAGKQITTSGTEVINDRPFGKVVAQRARLVNPQQVVLQAWMYDEDGITETTLVAGDRELPNPLQFEKETGLPTDLTYPLSLPNRGHALSLDGELYSAIIPLSELPTGLHRIEVHVSDQTGQTAVLPGPLVWHTPTPPLATCPGPKLQIFYPGEASFFAKAGWEISDLKALVNDGCVELGFRIRVEYLRTTAGKESDYVFDPDFPASAILYNGQGMTTMALNQALDIATRYQAPLLITLDGGVWADSKFAAPEWDIVDVLEANDAYVQWNQHGQAEPDTALANLPGSYDSPQLARMMSLNIYNTAYRAYKKRNLQLAVQRIVGWMVTRRNQSNQSDSADMANSANLPIKINLDPDSYINPWFYQTQWYDYNPATIRQFQEWLTGTGPYQKGAVLDGKGNQLPLSVINKIADQDWTQVSQIDPPRGPLDPLDPWYHLWVQFKRHLVSEHYADLARWAAEVGMPTDQIYTGQAFIDVQAAIQLDDTALNWLDQAGVSVAGSKPPDGHIGTILYGKTAQNEGTPRSGPSLMWNIQRLDPAWGVIEFHPAAIPFPKQMPSHTQAYHSMHALYNHGARFLSPMYGSSLADRELTPETFRSYAALQGSAFEYEFFWWLKQVHALPIGSLHFPFGNTHLVSDDGWVRATGTQLTSHPGYVVLETETARIAFRSPEFLAIPLDQHIQILVNGQWPAGAGLSARLTAPSHAPVTLACLPSEPTQWSCGAADQPDRQNAQNATDQTDSAQRADFAFTQMTLMWNLPASQQSMIQLDSVSLFRGTLPSREKEQGGHVQIQQPQSVWYLAPPVPNQFSPLIDSAR